MAHQPDVAIVGGGIIGLSAAYFLGRVGMSVDVFDRSGPGREASWAGAGILPPGNPDRAATPTDRLRAIGSVRFPAISQELRELTGIDNGYRLCGGIEFLQPYDEYVVPLWDREGIAVERLTPAALKRLEPALGDPPGRPYHLPGFAQVRNPWHLRALVAGCKAIGVRLRPGEPVRAVRPGGGVELDDGTRVESGRVLIAAGAWSERLLEPLGCCPGVHPVRGQIVLLNPGRPVIQRVVMLGKEYLVPRGDGRVLVGSTEEPEAGFEKANTADAVARLRALAVRTVPALGDAEIEACWAGLRPGSPDGLPYVGPVPGAANVFVATGHYRAGVQLSIGTSQLITDLLTGRPPCVPSDAFRPDREHQVGARPAFRS